jgi:thiamine-phosphate pyrophosphorylase
VNIFDSGQQPLIYLITKGETTAADFADKKKETLSLIENAVENKISLIQIREKQLPARLLFELARGAARITRKSVTKLLVNDRADIALAAGADGVHLTGGSLRAEIVRAHFPKDFIIGASAHTLADVLEAKKQKADFAVYSPIFETPGKAAPRGLAELREVCEAAKPFPVIGLGGIDETNYVSVLEIAGGFAAIRFLNDAENLRKLTKNIAIKN